MNHHGSHRLNVIGLGNILRQLQFRLVILVIKCHLNIAAGFRLNLVGVKPAKILCIYIIIHGGQIQVCAVLHLNNSIFAHIGSNKCIERHRTTLHTQRAIHC